MAFSTAFRATACARLDALFDGLGGQLLDARLNGGLDVILDRGDVLLDLGAFRR